MIRIIAFILLTNLLAQTAFAEAYSYGSISRRYADVEFDIKTVKRARMEGECLIGLKNINFRKNEDADAITEWANHQASALLQQFSPCTVLIMMEVANSNRKHHDLLKGR
jgi:hypothetical protein